MNSEHLALAARRLAQDAVTGEVVAAMRGRGVRPLLIKGPVLEQWLYGDWGLDGDPEVVSTDLREARRLGRAVGRALWVLPAERGCLAARSCSSICCTARVWAPHWRSARGPIRGSAPTPG